LNFLNYYTIIRLHFIKKQKL